MSELNHLSLLEHSAHVISLIGKGGSYIALCVILSLWCLYKRARSDRPLLDASFTARERLTWLMWSYWVFGTLLNQSLKFMIAQPRPWWINELTPPLSPHPSMGFGMPSGHAQGSVGLWLFIYLLYTMRKRADIMTPSILLRLSALICGLWVPLTMWARVELHAHSVAQVFAGMLVGLIWGAMLVRVFEANRAFRRLTVLSLICLGVLIAVYSVPVDPPEVWREAIRSHISEPLLFKPKLKVLIALSVASLGLLWSVNRHEGTRKNAA